VVFIEQCENKYREIEKRRYDLEQERKINNKCMENNIIYIDSDEEDGSPKKDWRIS
jgi:hypothetical protein